MALSVTTANPGTISGVTTANPGTINGVVSANTGVINGVSTSPNQAATNYNPQGSANSNIQPAATVNTVMPNTTSGQNVNQSGSAVFKFADGSAYDASGNQVTAPTTSGTSTGYSSGGAVAATQAPVMNTPTPTNTMDSTSLTGDNSNTGYSDIQKLLTDNLNNMDKLFSNLSQYATVSPEEQAQQQKVAGDQAAMTGLGYQAQGLYNPDNQTIALPFLTGQANNKLVGAGIQSTLDQSVLNYMQGNRQFAFNSASTIFNAAQSNLQNSLDAYTKMAPQNISTNYNPTTGSVNAIMRNPLTGQTYTADLGNIGAQKTFTNLSTPIPDPLNPGSYLVVGTKADGSVEQIHVGNGVSGTGGTLQGGTSGQVQGLGQVSVPGYGGAVNPQTNQPWRTDTNNNPIAAAVKVGGTNQFTKALDNAGVQWTYGTTFKDDPTMASIKILGNPVEGARAILSGSNALQGWYGTSTGSSIMQQLGIKNNTDFAKASTTTQNAIIDGIYRNEGGSGILTHPQAPSPDTTQLTDTYKAKYPTVANGVLNAPDGTPYIDLGSIPDSQDQRIAAITGPQYGIKALNKDDASTVKDIQNSIQNLKANWTIFQQLASSSGLGAVGQNVSGPLGQLFNTDKGNLLSTYQKNRDALFQQISSLAGSHPRLNAQELLNAAQSMPKLDEFNHDTLAAGQSKIALTQQYLDTAIKTLLPNYQGDVLGVGTPTKLKTTSTPDYTATLNNLINAYNPQ